MRKLLGISGSKSASRLSDGNRAVVIDPFDAELLRGHTRWDHPAIDTTAPNTLLVFDVGGLGQAQLRPEQAAALGSVDLRFVPVGGGPTIDTDRAGGDDGPVVVIPAAP